MSKNYKYYYTTHKLPARESARDIEYESEYNEECDSEEYYEANYDQECYNRQMMYADCIPEDGQNTKVQPPSEPTKSIPKTPSKLPYCIVPVLYVPKRIVQKEEIARNKVLQNSLASLSRMENLFYKYKANYENDAPKQTAPDINLPLPPQKGNVQDFLAPNAFINNSYYDDQYEYCTSSTNYDDDYDTSYRKPQFHEPFQDHHKAVSVVPKVQSSIPAYNYVYNYEQAVDPTMAFANQRSNACMDTSYYDRQPIDQYTRDDWLACQGRRSQMRYPMNCNVVGKFPRVFRNSQTNTTPKPASHHSIGINAKAEYDSKTSQTAGYLAVLEEKTSIYCEISTQTESQNYVGTIASHISRSSSKNREPKSDCETSNEAIQTHSTRSATMIPKLKTTLRSCSAAEAAKSCIHGKISCDMGQRNTAQTTMRAMSPEAARRFWK